MPAAELPLRDIHLPETVAWWPPAIGWWLLLGFITVLMILTIKLLQYNKNRKYSAANQAVETLQLIASTYAQSGDKKYLIREISSLIRRLCISLFPREQTANLLGDDWLLFLDQSMQPPNDDIKQNKPFSQGVGRILSKGPYSQQTDVDGEQLLQLCQQWISGVKKYAAQHRQEGTSEEKT